MDPNAYLLMVRVSIRDRVRISVRPGAMAVVEVKQEVRLMLTNLRDAFIGQSRSPSRRRFRIDTEVRCVGAHRPFWPLEPARVKPN